MHSAHWTLDSGLWTLDSGLWTLDSGLWTLDSGLWTLDSALCTLHSAHCTLHTAHSTQYTEPNIIKYTKRKPHTDIITEKYSLTLIYTQQTTLSNLHYTITTIN